MLLVIVYLEWTVWCPTLYHPLSQLQFDLNVEIAYAPLTIDLKFVNTEPQFPISSEGQTDCEFVKLN
jgi:hypothetical protein